MAAPPQQQHQPIRGIVKQVLSGDSVIIRDRPRGGPPPEWNCGLTSIQAPKLARRLAPGTAERLQQSAETKDEPYAFEAREFLRTRLVGREVLFTCETVVGSGNKRHYGILYDRVDAEGRVNMNEQLVREGLAEVRRTGQSQSEQQAALCALEDQAKADGKGKWSQAEASAKHVRDIVWKVDNLRHFVDSRQQKPIPAIVEHVRDGCTYRLLLVEPDGKYYSVGFMLSGVKTPAFKQQEEGGDAVPEPYAEEARFFVEARLLQKNVKVVLESVSGQSLVGSVLHANGNIAEILLREGLGRCVDWSMGVVSQGAANQLRAAEKEAKKARRRLWKDYVDTSEQQKSEQGFAVGGVIDGRVVEVGNGDNLVLKRQEQGDYVKVFLSSVRPPRFANTDAENNNQRARTKPLYDVPYMFEAREFLRKKLIGKRVTAKVDYVQAKTAEFPEKLCVTVRVGDVNVAEALVQKGLAHVLRYRADDSNRSSEYDALLAAEAVAQKKSAGVHSKKEPPTHKVADLAGDPKRAKQFLPSLQRSGRLEALVEFVASANRFRVYIPRSTCLTTLLLSGVECPRSGRRLPNGREEPGDPFGDEAARFAKELCLQREVEVEVESVDRGGNFIGQLFVDGVNMAVALVERGFGRVHFSAERGDWLAQLTKAEEAAKAGKLNVWSVEQPERQQQQQQQQQRQQQPERQEEQRECTVCELGAELAFCAVLADDSERLERLQAGLNEELERQPPVAGAYTPRKGDLCAARHPADRLWARARVLRPSDGLVQFVDKCGQASGVPLAQLPEALRSQAPLAVHCRLALVKLPPDEEDAEACVQQARQVALGKPALMRRLYEQDGVAYAALVEKASGQDVAELLIDNGLALLDKRRDRRLDELQSRYAAKETAALRSRRNIWRYGDIRDDDE